ncbi:hypothetical protein V8C86DRAFT_3083119 [Haematococcus lacustris]
MYYFGLKDTIQALFNRPAFLEYFRLGRDEAPGSFRASPAADQMRCKLDEKVPGRSIFDSVHAFLIDLGMDFVTVNGQSVAALTNMIRITVDKCFWDFVPIVITFMADLPARQAEAAHAAALAVKKNLRDGAVQYGAECRGARGVGVITQHLGDIASSLDIHVIPFYHTFCLGVEKDFLNHLFTPGSGLSDKAKDTIKARQKALHIPTDYGRAPTCCIDNRRNWIIEDYLHFIFTICTLLFAGLLPDNLAELLEYLRTAATHYLRPGDENQASEEAMNAAHMALRKYAYYMEKWMASMKVGWSGRQEKRRGLMYFKAWVGGHATPLNLEMSVATKEELVRTGCQEQALGANEDGLGLPGLHRGGEDEKPADDEVCNASQRCVLLGCKMPQPPSLAGEHCQDIKAAAMTFVKQQIKVDKDFPFREQHVHDIFPSSSGDAPAVMDHVLCFRRAECNEEVIHSSEYKRPMVRNSTWIQVDYQTSNDNSVSYAAHVLFWMRLQLPSTSLDPAFSEASEGSSDSSQTQTSMEKTYLRLAVCRLYKMTKPSAGPEAGFACYHSYGQPVRAAEEAGTEVPRGEQSRLVFGAGEHDLYLVDGETIKYKLVCCFPDGEEHGHMLFQQYVSSTVRDG